MTETFMKEEENRFWESGVLEVDNTTSLQCAVFFSNEKKVLYERRRSTYEPEVVTARAYRNGHIYTENVSKICAGAVAQLCVKNKWVSIFEKPETGNQCHCKLLDIYISKLQQKLRKMTSFACVP